MIDLGCDPGTTWTDAGDAVKALRDSGMRVSIDTFDPVEARIAAAAGAELVLSVNSSNRARAVEWGVEVVVDSGRARLARGLDATIEYLTSQQVRFPDDPILEPIGFGFAASLGAIPTSAARYPRSRRW